MVLKTKHRKTLLYLLLIVLFLQAIFFGDFMGNPYTLFGSIFISFFISGLIILSTLNDSKLTRISILLNLIYCIAFTFGMGIYSFLTYIVSMVLAVIVSGILLNRLKAEKYNSSIS